MYHQRATAIVLAVMLLSTAATTGVIASAHDAGRGTTVETADAGKTPAQPPRPRL